MSGYGNDAKGSAGRSVIAQNAGKTCALVVCGLLGFAALATIAETLAGATVIDAGLALVGFAFCLYAVLGLSLRSGAAADHLDGSRDVPAFIAGLGASASWLTAGTCLGLAGALFTLGFDGLLFVLGPLAGLALGTMLVVPFVARSGESTLASFLGRRFGPVARCLAALATILTSSLILAAGLSAFAGLAAPAFGTSFASAVAAGAALVLLCTLPGGQGGLAWTGAAQGLVILFGLMVPAAALTLNAWGSLLPPIALGEGLASVTGLETTMIENGAATAQALKPYTKPFLQIDALNFSALVASLMLGAAVLPTFVSWGAVTSSAREARSAGAWASLCVVLALLSVPALSVLGRLEIYRPVAERVALASLPEWMVELSETGAARFHGVSLGLFRAVTRAAGAEASDATAATHHIEARDPNWLGAWNALKDPVKAALLDAGRSTAAAAGEDGAADREAFRHKVLAAVAAASGNKAGTLTYSGLEIDGEALVLALPANAGLPSILSGLLLAAALSSALALEGAAAMSVAISLSHDLLPPSRQASGRGAGRVLALRLALMLALAAAGTAVTAGIEDFTALAPLAFSIAASALFPAVVLGIWCKRANAWGAVAGMAAGLAVALYYAAGLRYGPAGFFEVWSALSDAAPATVKKLSQLASDWEAAAPDLKAAAWAAVEAQARGALLDPGPANWLGISSLAAAVFAVPVGLAVMILVSLFTPRPSAAMLEFLDRSRRPVRETGPFGPTDL